MACDVRPCKRCGGTERYASRTCRQCAKQAALRRNQRLKTTDREAYNAGRRRYKHKLRMRVLEEYGGLHCRCCDMDIPMEWACIDHIEGGGNAHRRAIGRSDIHEWLLTNGFPPGYQVLCHNCNLAKGFYGVCPHQRVTEQLNVLARERLAKECA